MIFINNIDIKYLVQLIACIVLFCTSQETPSSENLNYDSVVPLLSEQRLKIIKESIKSNPRTYKALISKVDAYLTRIDISDKAYDLLPAMALRIAIEGDGTPKHWEMYFKEDLLSSIQEFDYKNRNNMRQHGADLIYSLIWSDAYYRGNLFSNLERKKAEKKISEWAQYWVNYYLSDKHKHLFPQDSDETTMLLENFLLMQFLVTGSTLKNLKEAHEKIKTQLEVNYIQENGIMAGGMWSESPSYNANTPRFYLRWREVYKQLGKMPLDNSWSDDHALFVLFSWMADFSGYWLFNDPIGVDAKYGGDFVYPASNFRSARFTTNPLIGAKYNNVRNGLLYVLNEIKWPGNASHYNGYIRLLFENNLIDKPINLSKLDLPNEYFSGGQGVFIARSNWSENANQFYSQNFTMWMVDHVGNMALNYEIFYNSKPVTKYAPSHGLSNHKNPANTIYIENMDTAGGLYPGVQSPTLRPKGVGANLGHYADEKYAAVIWDAKDIYNIIGYNQEADYAKQVTRSIINFWEGITFVYDNVKTDPKEIDDLYKSNSNIKAPYIREVMKLTRFQNMPVKIGEYYKATSGDVEHYYKILSKVDKIKVVNEKKDMPWAVMKPSEMYDSHKTAHIEEYINRENSEFLAMHVWGNKNIKLPKQCNIEVNSLDVLGYCYQLNNETNVMLFNRNPENPIEDDISFTLEGLSNKFNLYALGWSVDKRFSTHVIEDKNQILVRSGSGVRPNSGLVFTSFH